MCVTEMACIATSVGGCTHRCKLACHLPGLMTMILLIIRRRRDTEQHLKLVCSAMLLCVVYFSLEYVVLVSWSAGAAAS